MADGPSGTTTEQPPEGNSPGTGALDAAAAQLKNFSDKTDEIRKRTDITSKFIYTVGTAAISALGVAKFFDVFPYESGFLEGAALLIGFVALAVGTMWLARGFVEAQKPLVMVADSNRVTSDPAELALVDQIFEEQAILNGTDSLRAYDARGWRLRRAAQSLGGGVGKALEMEADLISTEVQMTFRRAAHAVIRRRAHEAAVGGRAMIAYVLILGGLGLATLASDEIVSARDDKGGATASSRLDFQTKCAGTLKAGVEETDLPAGCPDPITPPAETPAAEGEGAATPEDVLDDAGVAASTALTECRAAARSANDDELVCRRLEQAVESLLLSSTEASPPEVGLPSDG